MAVNLTNDNAKEFMATELPIVLDFSAAWCGPCKMLTPILEEVQKEVSIPMYKVNIDECENVARSLGIMSIPTMIVFKNGEEQEKIIGLRQKDAILEVLKKY